MKIETLFTHRTAGLAAAALLTVVFAGGCQTTDDSSRTIHVPPGGARFSVPAGTKIDIPTASTIDVPGGSTIHVPPGGSGANDVSKEGPRRGHHPHSEHMMMSAPPATITHPGG